MGQPKSYPEQTTIDNSDKFVLQDGVSDAVKYAQGLTLAIYALSKLAAATSYANPGSAGGTFYQLTIGGNRFLFGRTGTMAVSGTGFQSTTLTLTLPVSYFTTIRAIQLTTDAPSASQYLSPGVSTSSASSININLNQSNGTNGSAAVNVLVIGT